MTLLRLETLVPGGPCSENSCATTIAYLVPISVYGVKLRTLEIHSNTTSIVNDPKDISGNPRFQVLYSLPRCTLSRLGSSAMQLFLDEPDTETVVEGMIDIFPSLNCYEEPCGRWDLISREFQEVQWWFPARCKWASSIARYVSCFRITDGSVRREKNPRVRSHPLDRIPDEPVLRLSTIINTRE